MCSAGMPPTAVAPAHTPTPPTKHHQSLVKPPALETLRPVPPSWQACGWNANTLAELKAALCTPLCALEAAAGPLT